MHQVTIYGRTYPVPARWNELTESQLRQLAPLVFSRAPVLLVRARVLAALLEVRRRPRLFLQMWTLPASEWAALRVCTDWFFQQVQLTNNVIPTVQERFFVPALLGPGNMLAGVSFEEFIAAEGHYEAWRGGDDAAMIRLAATLYRPQRRDVDEWKQHPDYNNDHREPFNKARADGRVDLVATWPTAVVQAVLIYYDSCRSRIIARYKKTIFRKPEGPPSTDKAPLAWAKALRALAGSLTSFDTVAKMSLGTVLFDFDEKIKEADQLKAEIEKLKQK